MQQRYTGYDFGKSNRFQNAAQSRVDSASRAEENQLNRANQLEILSSQLTAQKDIADERNKLTKQQMDFADAEKRRRDAFESQTLKYRDDDKERQEGIRLALIAKDESRDSDTHAYRTKVLATQINAVKSASFKTYGFDNTDARGESLPSTIKDETGKLTPNPVLVERGAQFDGTRLVSTQESVMNAQSLNRIDETLGLLKAQKTLEKINKANQTPVDPLLFDSNERGGVTGLGFDEENALDNLKQQSAQWADVVDLMSVLPANNAKRKFLLNSMIELRGELRGDKYASATASYAIDSKRYGKLRGGLASSLDSYIDRLK